MESNIRSVEVEIVAAAIIQIKVHYKEEGREEGREEGKKSKQ